MNKPTSVADMTEDEYGTFDVHLIKKTSTFAHIASLNCPCNPSPDKDEPSIIVHHG